MKHFLKRTKYLILGLLVLSVIVVIGLSYQIELIQQLYSSKSWCHRVNSIEKLKIVQKDYAGIELDVVYDKTLNLYDVNHPPALSINLNLNEYLKSFDINQGIWLDVKHLSKDDVRAAVKHLNDILKGLSIKPQDVIVELNDLHSLVYFKNSGYQTSYYVQEVAYESLKNNDQEFIDTVNASLRKKELDYLSFDIKYYKLVKEKFPDANKLTWLLNHPPKIRNLYSLKRNFINLDFHLEVINDEHIKVVLFSNQLPDIER